MPGGEGVGDACVIVGTSVCGTSGGRRTPSPSSRKDSVTGSSVAPVRRASVAGPAGIRAVGAEEAHVDAARGQVAVGSRHSVPPASSRSTSTSKGGRGAAGQRQHLHAERLAEGDEAVVQRLGLQPLGDRRERARPVAPHQAPAWSQLPLCGSARIVPAPARRVAQPVLATVACPRRPARRGDRQPEHLAPVAGVRPQRVAGQRVEVAVRRDPRQVARSRSTRRAAAARARSAPARNRTVAARSGSARTPAQPVA
jgi:hypothetical protein